MQLSTLVSWFYCFGDSLSTRLLKLSVATKDLDNSCDSELLQKMTTLPRRCRYTLIEFKYGRNKFQSAL